MTRALALFLALCLASPAHADGAILGVPSTFVSGPFTQVGTPIASVSFGTGYQYNADCGGGSGSCTGTQYFNGDTLYATVCDDGVTYITAADTHGPNNASGAGSNMDINSLSSYTTTLANYSITAINYLNSTSSPYGFGNFDTSGGPGGTTYKPSGLICVGGVLYMVAGLNTYNSSTSPYIQTATSAQIIKSTDHGVTWTPTPTSSNGGALSSYMFTSGNGYAQFTTPSFIQYSDNYANNPSIDNAQTYVYAYSNYSSVTSSGCWNDCDFVILGRVKVSDIGSLDQTKWSFYVGGDGTQDGAWSSSPANAANLLYGQYQQGIFSASYIPSKGRYLGIVWYYPSVPSSLPATSSTWLIMEAPHPWGPWKQIGSQTFGTCTTYSAACGLYGPVILPASVDASGSTVQVLASGNFKSANAYNGFYTPTFVPMTLN